MKRKRDDDAGEDDQANDNQEDEVRHHPPWPDLSCPEKFEDVDPGAQSALDNQNNNQEDVLLAEQQFKSLIEREVAFGFTRNERSATDLWVHRSRQRAIDWVMTTSARFGYRNRTAYLAITLFDRFFVLKFIRNDINNREKVMRLVWIACLSLAAKMDESRIQRLSDYEVENFLFGISEIHEMEITVFKALDWRLNLITPFMYLEYFIYRLWQEEEEEEQAPPDVMYRIGRLLTPPDDVMYRIGRLLISIMTDINLMHHRPSSVAAAATLVALDDELTPEGVRLMNKRIDSGLQDARKLNSEDVYHCYQLLQEHI